MSISSPIEVLSIEELDREARNYYAAGDKEMGDYYIYLSDLKRQNICNNKRSNSYDDLKT